MCCDLVNLPCSLVASDREAQRELLKRLGEMDVGVTADLRDLLIEAAVAPAAERDVALCALLLFAPLPEITEVLDRAD